MWNYGRGLQTENRKCLQCFQCTIVQECNMHQVSSPETCWHSLSSLIPDLFRLSRRRLETCAFSSYLIYHRPPTPLHLQHWRGAWARKTPPRPGRFKHCDHTSMPHARMTLASELNLGFAVCPSVLYRIIYCFLGARGCLHTPHHPPPSWPFQINYSSIILPLNYSAILPKHYRLL